MRHSRGRGPFCGLTGVVRTVARRRALKAAEGYRAGEMPRGRLPSEPLPKQDDSPLRASLLERLGRK